MRFLAVAAPLVLSVIASCTTTPNAASGSALRAKDFYPLAIGNRWEYKITPAPPDKPTGTVKVIDKDAEGFFLDDQGGRLAPRTDGVFDGVQKRFMIEEPLEEGHEWIAVPKDDPGAVERYKIIAVGTSATVPAGTFEGCMQVQVLMKVPQKGEMKMTWTYAPAVGLIKAVQIVTPPNAEPFTAMTMELVSYELKPQG